MLACVFAKAFQGDALLKGSLYFLVFILFIFLINYLIDFLNRKK